MIGSELRVVIYVTQRFSMQIPGGRDSRTRGLKRVFASAASKNSVSLRYSSSKHFGMTRSLLTFNVNAFQRPASPSLSANLARS